MALRPALLIAAAALAHGPGAAQESTPRADPPPPLTEFQWAIRSAGALLLVPVEGYLYPAAREGEGIIETWPERIAVTLLTDGTRLSVPLHQLHSPMQMLGPEWIAERRTGDHWRPVAALHFHGMSYYVQPMPGPFEPVDASELRFRPR